MTALAALAELSRRTAAASPAFRDPIAWEESLPIRQSSPAWRAVIRAAYGSPLAPAELELFRSLAGRDPPVGGAPELLGVAGRRGGKSETIARVGAFEALFVPHARSLAPGQRGLVVVISPLREQSQEIMGYARGLCALPAVRCYLEAEPLRDEIRFTTGITLRVMTADAVNVSGPTVVCAIRDEWAKWPGDDTAMPDREIENSLRPALAPVRGAPTRRLIGITSAYIREGVAYETDNDHFGRTDSAVLVVRGSTMAFNPNVDTDWLSAERQRVGERVFAREYLCEWQDAVVDGYFADVLDGAIDRGRVSTEPVAGVDYVIALDPAWRHDRFALAVAHRERREGALVTVVDRVQAWIPPPGGTLSTDDTIARVAEIAGRYGADSVFSDQAAAPALAEVCRRHGLDLREVPWTGGVGTNSKTSKYRRTHVAMGLGHVRLPDDAPTVREFANISARLLRSGGEQIEARVGHDDRVSACVLAVTEAMRLDPDYGVARAPEAGSAEAMRAAARARCDPLELRAMAAVEQEQQAEERRSRGMSRMGWARFRRG